MGVLAIGHELESERAKLPGGRCRERGLWRGLPGAAKIGFAVVVAVSRRWQLQQAVVLHAQHGHAAAHVLELSVVATPSELFADKARKTGASRRRVIHNKLLDTLNLGRRERPSAIMHPGCSGAFGLEGKGCSIEK